MIDYTLDKENSVLHVRATGPLRENDFDTLAVAVDPFTPPVLGHKMVGQFEVWSYPAFGTYLLLGFGLLLVGGFYFTWRHATADSESSSEKGNGGES